MNQSLSIENETTYVIRQMNLLNWGSFGGRHQFHLHPQGAAIIGPTGSGKTTLIDALMTLLVAQPKYNLASSGGHDSDRSLMSYIRGVTGGGEDFVHGELTARRGKTVTGLSVTLENGHNSVQLAAVLWIDSGSTANADRKDLWIFCEDTDLSLDDWLQAHHESGARGLKALAKSTPGLQVFDTRRSYLAHVRRFFAVGDNAFLLLNRAAGLKQLNSVDEIFRELVLDDHAMFDRALDVCRDFDGLTEIHQELLTAREQVASLKPLAGLHRDHKQSKQRIAELIQLSELLPEWIARTGERLWTQQSDHLDGKISATSAKINETQARLTRQSDRTQALHSDYLKAGGSDVTHLNELVDARQERLSERETNASHYRNITKMLGLDPSLNHGTFQTNIEQAEEIQQKLKNRIDQEREVVGLAKADKTRLESALKSLDGEIAEARKRPDSNVPGRYQQFRTQLAQAIHFDEESLPFIAELVEVKPDQEEWQGAIERALGGHRLRVLVPEDRLQQALAWVNKRDNELHVRLMSADNSGKHAEFLSDGFARKLNFKQHPSRDVMKVLLANIDRHCVDRIGQLQTTPYSMTKQGTMSGRSGQFEKRDEKPLTADWYTGFSNRNLLMTLTTQQKSAQVELLDCQQRLAAAEKKLDDSEQRLRLIAALLEQKFEQVDVPAAKTELDELLRRRELLLQPDSESTIALARYEEARIQLDNLQQELQSSGNTLAVLESKLTEAEENRKACIGRQSGAWDDGKAQIAAANFLEVVEPAQLDAAERAEQARLFKELEKVRARQESLEKKILIQMADAKGCDTGALVDFATDVAEIDEYLNRLRVLETEALPEKLGRFLDYLNLSSDQGVNQLLSEVDEQVTHIEERISSLNQKLGLVDYQEGRILKLAPQQVRHESIRELEQARSRLRSAKLADDKDGEQQYAALKRLIDLLRSAGENRAQARSRAMLDPRYRLQFAYEIVDKTSGEVVDRRTSSKGGSGGEKEIIASYILTASLSYALCPSGALRPLFGTVVLDEAFSKSSQMVAARIIAALKEFNLHALFVTPNKEMQLLKKHTRSAVLVHRKGMQSTLTEFSWEEIEEQINRQKSHDVEKAR